MAKDNETMLLGFKPEEHKALIDSLNDFNKKNGISITRQRYIKLILSEHFENEKKSKK